MIKASVQKALVASGATRLAARFQPKSAAILMYHSVMDDPSRAADSLGGIIHSERDFRAQMELLAREFRPVDLARLRPFVEGMSDLPERSVAITFDDGYTDNYEQAVPILNQVGIPATFYVTVDCVEHRRLPWPSRLRFSFRTTQKTQFVHDDGKSSGLGTAQDRERAYLKVCDEVCKFSGAALERKVAEIEDALDMRLPAPSGELMMTWDQVKGLAQGGHAVGSHTMTHPNVAFLRIDDARRELLESKQLLESRIGSTVEHFSYPCPALFPNWTKETIEESRRVGYQTAVTTNNGVTRVKDDPLALKRVRPTKTVEGLRWNLESAFAGRVV